MGRVKKMLFKTKENKPNILLFSGGKDSTALLLMILNKEINITIEEIIFCDTGMEFPEMYDHINKIKKQLKIPITILKPPRSFNYLMFKHIQKKGKNKGIKGYAWPSGRVNWCTGFLKRDVSNKYIKQKYLNGYNEIVGIAFDEFKRLNNKDKKIYPLAENKITEGMCLKYCYDHGFDWDGLYVKFDRVSCWCCPQKNKRELYMIYSFYPKLWNRLKLMDKKSWNTFKGKRSVISYEEEFKEY